MLPGMIKTLSSSSGRQRIDFGGPTESGSTLHVDIQQQVDIPVQLITDFTFQGTVAAIVHLYPFVELARFYALLEFFIGEKVVILPVLFALSGRPCGRGDDTLQARAESLDHTVADSGLGIATLVFYVSR